MKPTDNATYHWITTVYRSGEMLIGFWYEDHWQVLPWEGIPDVHGWINPEDVTWCGKSIEIEYPPKNN